MNEKQSENASMSREECGVWARDEYGGLLGRLARAHIALLDSSEQTIARLARERDEAIAYVSMEQAIAVRMQSERDTLRNQLAQAQKDTELLASALRITNCVIYHLPQCRTSWQPPEVCDCSAQDIIDANEAILTDIARSEPIANAQKEKK